MSRGVLRVSRVGYKISVGTLVHPMFFLCRYPRYYGILLDSSVGTLRAEYLCTQNTCPRNNSGYIRLSKYVYPVKYLLVGWIESIILMERKKKKQMNI